MFFSAGREHTRDRFGREHSRNFQHPFRGLTILVFGVALLWLPLPTQAQERDPASRDHVVSSQDLHREVLKASEAREQNLAKVEKFFSGQPARQALDKARMDYRQVTDAVRMLDDQELGRLASRTEKIQNDFAAGALTNQEITYILIALAVAVVILVIVAA